MGDKQNAIACALFLVSCTRSGPDDSPSDAAASPPPCSVATTPVIAELDGDCDQGQPIAYSPDAGEVRPVGELSRYDVLVRTRANSLGFVRVRANAVWPAEDLSNVLGTIPTHTCLLAEGPLKNDEFSAGIGYAVAVRDATGHVCRGYVAATVVDELSRSR